MSIVNLCTCFVAWICEGAQPGLALVVSVGNCSISAAYQLFDFPRESRISKAGYPGAQRSSWKPSGYRMKIQIHLRSTEFNTSLLFYLIKHTQIK